MLNVFPEVFLQEKLMLYMKLPSKQEQKEENSWVPGAVVFAVLSRKKIKSLMLKRLWISFFMSRFLLKQMAHASFITEQKIR